jgi:hypothetical protein
VLVRCTQHTRHNDAIFGACFEHAYWVVETLVGVGLQVSPALIGASQQGHVIGVFKVGLTNDACAAVRAAAGMTWFEPVETEHAKSLGCQIVGSYAA